MPLYLGIDVGTQSAKAVAWDSGLRRVVGRGSKSYPILQTTVPGRAEQDPATWIEAGKGAIDEALAELNRSSVRGVGVSGQQHGLVPLDSAGRVIRPAKLWCDVEAKAQAQRLSAALEWKIPPGFTAPKIWWLKDNERANFDRLAHVLLPHDYFNYFLTGVMAMECGDASGTGVFDLESRSFDADAMAVIDARLPGCFPPLIGAGDVVGVVRPEVAAELGLPEGVVVAPGSGDNMMSAVGAGAVRDGDLVISLGTSGTLFASSARPVVDRSGAIAPFCSATGDWLPLFCTANCTGPAEAVRTMFSMSYAEIGAAAEAAPPGASGVNFLPYLSGERTPSWPHATGAILGLRPGSFSAGVLYRAALEGSTFSLLSALELFRKNGLPCQRASLVGGGSQNRLWRSIIADVLGIPLQFPREKESAALGGALQAAAVHQGVPIAEFVLDHVPDFEDAIVEPSTANSDTYREAYERHRRLSDVLFEDSAISP